jgi:hypothetical protein
MYGPSSERTVEEDSHVSLTIPDTESKSLCDKMSALAIPFLLPLLANIVPPAAELFKAGVDVHQHFNKSSLSETANPGTNNALLDERIDFVELREMVNNLPKTISPSEIRKLHEDLKKVSEKSHQLKDMIASAAYVPQNKSERMNSAFSQVL